MLGEAGQMDVRSFVGDVPDVIPGGRESKDNSDAVL
jgi:hypothetical protein